jgi:RNA polymerase sigma-70 factor (ECF subfamily)
VETDEEMDITMTKADAASLPTVASSDPISFEELYEMYKTHIYRFARALTRDAGEAEDLFQDTWLRVAQGFGRRPLAENCRAWLFTITSNLHKDALRKKKVRRLFWLEKTKSIKSAAEDRGSAWEPGAVTTGDGARRTEFQLCLARAVSSLPPKQRRVFVLKEIEGFKHSDISGILRIPENTVRTILHRAVKNLQCKLAEFNPAQSPNPGTPRVTGNRGADPEEKENRP